MADFNDKDKSGLDNTDAGLFDKFINYILDKIDHEPARDDVIFSPSQDNHSNTDFFLNTNGDHFHFGNLGQMHMPADQSHDSVSMQPVNQNAGEQHPDYHMGEDVLHDDVAYTGQIISFESISSYYHPLNTDHVANDLGHNVMLDASDVLEMGNNLVITGHEMDSVNFQDAGWMQIDQAVSLPGCISPREGYNTYMHESGAIVQIEAVIHTNFDPHGNM